MASNHNSRVNAFSQQQRESFRSRPQHQGRNDEESPRPMRPGRAEGSSRPQPRFNTEVTTPRTPERRPPTSMPGAPQKPKRIHLTSELDELAKSLAFTTYKSLKYKESPAFHQFCDEYRELINKCLDLLQEFFYDLDTIKSKHLSHGKARCIEMAIGACVNLQEKMQPVFNFINGDRRNILQVSLLYNGIFANKKSSSQTTTTFLHVAYKVSGFLATVTYYRPNGKNCIYNQTDLMYTMNSYVDSNATFPESKQQQIDEEVTEGTD